MIYSKNEENYENELILFAFHFLLGFMDTFLLVICNFKTQNEHSR